MSVARQAKAAGWHAEVDQLGRRWLMETKLKREDAKRLMEALDQLTKLYAHHLVVEDESVFPLAAAVLPHTEKAHIGIEMAQRRGLDRPQENLGTGGRTGWHFEMRYGLST